MQKHLEVFETEQMTTNESHQSLSKTLKRLEYKFAELEKDLLGQKMIVDTFEVEYGRMQTVHAELTELLRNERL
jgi:hypothetical protein